MSTTTARAVRSGKTPGGAAPAASTRGKGRGIRYNWWGTPWIFLAFGLTIVGVFTVFPFLNTLVLAFTDATRLRAGEFIQLVKYAASLANTKMIEFSEVNPKFDIDNSTTRLVAIAMHRFISHVA